MSKISKSSFGWVGQFSGFVAGDKSPYQYLAMRVAVVDESHAEVSLNDDPRQMVKLGKSLRRMMVGYLSPEEWIRVVGEVKVASKTGDLQWKAREIVKISTQQAIRHARERTKAQSLTTVLPKRGFAITPQPKPTKVLICQKSSCRQRGSQAVADAIAHTVASHDKSESIQLVATGCMKQCKAGPHIVLIPGKQSSAPSSSPSTRLQPQSKTKYNSVTPATAQQIARQLVKVSAESVQ